MSDEEKNLRREGERRWGVGEEEGDQAERGKILNPFYPVRVSDARINGTNKSKQRCKRETTGWVSDWEVGEFAPTTVTRRVVQGLGVFGLRTKLCREDNLTCGGIGIGAAQPSLSLNLYFRVRRETNSELRSTFNERFGSVALVRVAVVIRRGIALCRRAPPLPRAIPRVTHAAGASYDELGCSIHIQPVAKCPQHRLLLGTSRSGDSRRPCWRLNSSPARLPQLAPPRESRDPAHVMTLVLTATAINKPSNFKRPTLSAHSIYIYILTYIP